MSIRVMTWVWDHSQSGGNDRLVLLAIADCAHDDGTCAYPSVKELARKTRVCTRTVQRCLQNLVELGELRIEDGARQHRPNTYAVLVQGRQSVTPAEVTNSHPSEPPKAPRGDTCVAPGVTTVSPEPSVNRKKLKNTSATATPKRVLDEHFDQWWAAYPKHRGKIDARRAYERRVRAGVSFDALLTGAHRYAEDPNREPGFTKDPATWLNKGSWDDDPLPCRDRTTLRSVPDTPLPVENPMDRMAAWKAQQAQNRNTPLFADRKATP